MPEQRFRIAPTSRGALFRAKRWFYATFYTGAPPEVREENRGAWVEVARRLVEEINKRDAGNLPARITLRYETGPKGEFKPMSATVELMEMKPVDTFTVYFAPEEAEGEKEKIKKQLGELLKKAKELGISLEELE